MNDTVIQALFWLSCFGIFWTYFGYYILLRVCSIFFSRKVHKGDVKPSVSMIVTAYNEESRIARKLDNCLKPDYPKDKLEIIVVSDGSNDGTVGVVSQYADRGIKMVAVPKRQGKHRAQEVGIRGTTGEIIIFTDTATILEADAVREIVRNFSDPEIGCVSGIDKIETSDRAAQGERLYVGYEMRLRELESKVSSLLGVSGSFFAVRRSICATWYGEISSDFWIPVKARMQGFRTVLDPDAVGSYGLTELPQQEFARKVRTVVHGLDVLFRFAAVLNPLRYGFYSFQMFSHKLLRWLVPFLLIVCLATNLMLVEDRPPYQVLFAAQVITYLAALSALLMRGLEKSSLFRIPFFFVMANLSILAAWYKYLRGERFLMWERTER